MIEAFSQASNVVMKILLSIIAIVLSVLDAPCALAIQDGKEASIVRIVTNKRKSFVGEVTRENNKHIEIFDLASGKNQIFKKDEIADIRKSLAAQSIVEKVGLANYLAWKIGKSIPAEKVDGLIAELDGGVVYINRGSKSGVEIGQKLGVYRQTGKITDPKSGSVIGIRKRQIAKVGVFQIQDNLCKARIEGEFEVGLEVGDLIEGHVNRAIAILPLVEGGSESMTTSHLSESILTGVVQRGIKLVERSLLSKVVKELSRQKDVAFDKGKAQIIGGQLGAFAVLAGSIERSRNFSTIRVRLIRVATGEILFTASIKSRDIVTTPTVNKEGLKELFAGRFDVVWTELQSGKKGTVVYEFLRNGIVKKAGTKIGEWEVKDDYLSVRFLDVKRGYVIVRPQTKSKFSGIHHWEDGRKSTWIGRRK